MSAVVVRPAVRTGAGNAVERTRVLVLGGLIVAGVGGYLFLNTTSAGRDSQRNLLPYQTLARTLPESEQSLFQALQKGQLAAEAERVRTSRWPDVPALASAGVAPFAASRSAAAQSAAAQPAGAVGGANAATMRWEQFQRGTMVNYVGVPADESAPAWLLAVQEPEPGALPDPAPVDEEHHRLADGTVLHIYIWMHRYGGRVAPRFVPQPQNDGWIQVFSAPPNPVLPPRR
jgi:hypothetical protein